MWTFCISTIFNLLQCVVQSVSSSLLLFDNTLRITTLLVIKAKTKTKPKKKSENKNKIFFLTHAFRSRKTLFTKLQAVFNQIIWLNNNNKKNYYSIYFYTCRPISGAQKLNEVPINLWFPTNFSFCYNTWILPLHEPCGQLTFHDKTLLV